MFSKKLGLFGLGSLIIGFGFAPQSSSAGAVLDALHQSMSMVPIESAYNEICRTIVTNPQLECATKSYMQQMGESISQSDFEAFLNLDLLGKSKLSKKIIPFDQLSSKLDELVASLHLKSSDRVTQLKKKLQQSIASEGPDVVLIEGMNWSPADAHQFIAVLKPNKKMDVLEVLILFSGSVDNYFLK